MPRPDSFGRTVKQFTYKKEQMSESYDCFVKTDDETLFQNAAHVIVIPMNMSPLDRLKLSLNLAKSDVLEAITEAFREGDNELLDALDEAQNYITAARNTIIHSQWPHNS